MANDDNQQFVQEVADRGIQAYHMLHLYDHSDCINLYHGDGALPPHPSIQTALKVVVNKMEIWNEVDEEDKPVQLRRYRVANIIIIPELRQAILDDFCRYMPSNFDRSEAVVHIGGGVTQLVAGMFTHFRQSNGILLMFAPTYTSFLCSICTLGNNIRLIKPSSNGHITPEQIENALSQYPAAEAIFLINPNNPTGQYFNKSELEKIARVAMKHDIIVIVDEVFHKLVFDFQNKFMSMASIEIDGKRMFERTITLRSVSKDHGLAAIRSGYAIGPKELMNKLRFQLFTFVTTFNVDDLAQHLTLAALTHTPREYYLTQKALLRRHRDIVTKTAEEINERVGYIALKAYQPAAGIFQIIDAAGLRDRVYNETILTTDIILCELLLQGGKGGVAVYPASSGGFDPSDMKIRLTLSSTEKAIHLGLKRLGDFVEKCRAILNKTGS